MGVRFTYAALLILQMEFNNSYVAVSILMFNLNINVMKRVIKIIKQLFNNWSNSRSMIPTGGRLDY